jgi:hypothetical protein
MAVARTVPVSIPHNSPLATPEAQRGRFALLELERERHRDQRPRASLAA